jgi:hypothetical protein
MDVIGCVAAMPAASRMLRRQMLTSAFQSHPFMSVSEALRE